MTRKITEEILREVEGLREKLGASRILIIMEDAYHEDTDKIVYRVEGGKLSRKWGGYFWDELLLNVTNDHEVAIIEREGKGRDRDG